MIEENAPDGSRPWSTVRAWSRPAIVRAGDDRVQVLVFVDRPDDQRQGPPSRIYRDQVTVTMERVGDEWLVDDMKTSPAAG